MKWFSHMHQTTHSDIHIEYFSSSLCAGFMYFSKPYKCGLELSINCICWCHFCDDILIFQCPNETNIFDSVISTYSFSPIDFIDFGIPFQHRDPQYEAILHVVSYPVCTLFTSNCQVICRISNAAPLVWFVLS